jgi:hypothetical protein
VEGQVLLMTTNGKVDDTMALPLVEEAGPEAETEEDQT